MLTVNVHASQVREPFINAVELGLLRPFDDTDSVKSLIPTGVSDAALAKTTFNGKVQGVFQPRTYLPALAFNIEHLSAAEVASLKSGKISDYLPLLKAFHADTGQRPFVLSTADLRSELGWSYIEGIEGLLIGENLKLMNPLASERFRDQYVKLFQLYEQDLVAFSLAPSAHIEDFLVAKISTERLRAYEASIASPLTSLDADKECRAFIVPDIEAPYLSLGRTLPLTAVASWTQNLEHAQDFLSRLYEDADFSNLIQHGIEGIDFEMEGGHAVDKEDGRGFISLFGPFYLNSLNASPSIDQELDRKQAAWTLEQANPYRELSGFRFDPTPVQDEIAAMNALFPFTFNYAAPPPQVIQKLLFCGFDDESEIFEAIDEIVQLQEDAGSQRIIAEFERQVETWRENKSPSHIKNADAD